MHSDIYWPSWSNGCVSTEEACLETLCCYHMFHAFCHVGFGHKCEGLFMKGFQEPLFGFIAESRSQNYFFRNLWGH